MKRKLAAILAVDVVGYSRLMKQDEAGTFERLRALRKELFEPIEKHMTFKIADIANEAQFIEIADQLSNALSGDTPFDKPLDLNPDYVDAAKSLLATLSGRSAPLPSGTVALTEQQIETFLDFDPDFLDVAKFTPSLRVFSQATVI